MPIIHALGILNLLNSLFFWGYFFIEPSGPPHPWFIVNAIIRYMLVFGFILDFLVVIHFIYACYFIFFLSKMSKGERKKHYYKGDYIIRRLSEMSDMVNKNAILIVGLGNPGKKYEKNRHNIGFMAIDSIADGAENFPAFRNKFQGEMTERNISGKKVILLKPQTYMNESGQSVRAAIDFYKLSPDQICVFHDELDLEPAKVRFKTGGGNAGHNGLKSIQKHLGTPDFNRIRIGIGHPGHKDRVSGYVLSDFAKSEQDWVEAMVDSLADQSGLLFQGKAKDYIEKVSNDVALATGKGKNGN